MVALVTDGGLRRRLGSWNSRGSPSTASLWMRRQATRLHLLLAIVAGSAACSERSEDPAVPGFAEYQLLEPESLPDSHFRIYREGAEVRFEWVNRDEVPRCRVLADWAVEDIERTIESLDPSADYDSPECEAGTSPPVPAERHLHLEGFPRSPYACSAFCCQGELRPIGSVYSHLVVDFDRGELQTADGGTTSAYDQSASCL